MQLGKALVMQKEYERAIALYEEGLQSSPENPDLLTAVGLLYLQLGKTPKAFNYVAKCLTINSSNPTAIMAAAGVMQENGDFSVALHKYRVAVPQLSHSARLWSNIGMCFFGQQNMHAAVACLRKAVALAPFEWRITYNMGLVFLHLRQLASAFHYLAATTHLQPHYAPAYMHLGVCSALMNDTVNASAAYKRALAIDQDLLILLNYTITLVNAGKMEEARIQMEGFMRVWAHKDKRERMEWGPVFLRTVKLLNMRLSIGTGMYDLNNICKKNSNDDDKVCSRSSSSSGSTNGINGEGSNSRNTIEVEAERESSDEVENNNV
ncbi:hypothetical protein LSM04_000564 [Trypanosoma melophagium]|nr:hypothetical protein LSM04_000564 [Trypanosoma melophagium]